MTFELGIYKTLDGHLAHITSRSHGCLLHGRVMLNDVNHTWICGGTWRIHPWSLNANYIGQVAHFDRGDKVVPGYALLERVD